MQDIYTPPKSELDNAIPSDEEERKRYQEVEALRLLYQSQRVIWSPVNALIVSAFLVLAISWYGGSAPVLVFMLPAIVTGAMVKYMGKLIQMKHRVISGLVVGLVVTLALSLNNLVLASIIGLLNVLAFMAISKRPLTFDEEKLLFKESIGKLER